MLLVDEIANQRSNEYQFINPPEHVQQAMEHHFVPIVLMSDSLDKMILLLIDM